MKASTQWADVPMPRSGGVPWKTNLDTVILLWVLEGEAHVWCGEENFSLGPWRAVWIPPRMARRVEHSAGSVVIAIPLPEREAGDHANKLRFVDVPESLRDWALYYAMGKLTPFRPHSFTSKSLAQLVSGLPDVVPGPCLDEPPLPRHRLALRAALAIRANPAASFSVVEWAAQLNCDERTLRRVFAAETGHTFGAWRTVTRLRQVQLLVASGVPLEHAGQASGYDTEKAFKQAWKRRLGTAFDVAPQVRTPTPRGVGARFAPPRSSTPRTVTAWQSNSEEHQFIWVFQGRCQLSLAIGHAGPDSTDRAVHQLKAGQAMWVAAGTAFSVHVEQGSIAFPLHFPAATPELFPGEFHARNRLPVRIPGAWRTVMHNHALAHLTAIAPLNYRASDALVDLRKLPGYPGLQLPAESAAARICTALLKDPRNPRTLDQWARIYGFSPRTLQRTFAAETGLSFARWRLRLRMETAANLLESSMGVGRVAIHVGYADISTFSRAFRDYFGRAPTRK